METIFFYFYVFDIFISFVTAIQENDNYIEDLRSIALNYIRTFFIVDFLSVLPGFLTFFLDEEKT